MDYVAISEARIKSGLRLVMNKGVPGPWSQAAKYVFETKSIPYVAVAQLGGTMNNELYDWTGHRNAPIAVYDDEPPRIGWQEIIMLAERLTSVPTLLPKKKFCCTGGTLWTYHGGRFRERLRLAATPAINQRANQQLGSAVSKWR